MGSLETSRQSGDNYEMERRWSGCSFQVFVQVDCSQIDMSVIRPQPHAQTSPCTISILVRSISLSPDPIVSRNISHLIQLSSCRWSKLVNGLCSFVRNNRCGIGWRALCPHSWSLIIHSFPSHRSHSLHRRVVWHCHTSCHVTNHGFCPRNCC